MLRHRIALFGKFWSILSPQAVFLGIQNNANKISNLPLLIVGSIRKLTNTQVLNWAIFSPKLFTFDFRKLLENKAFLDAGQMVHGCPKSAAIKGCCHKKIKLYCNFYFGYKIPLYLIFGLINSILLNSSQLVLRSCGCNHMHVVQRQFF